MKNPLDVQVSLFSSMTNPVPIRDVNLYEWLTKTNGILIKHVNMCRSCHDKNKRGRIKRNFYAITPSGIFLHQRNDALLKSSGLISIDVDHIDTTEAKEKLKTLPYVAYAGLSVSGDGVWALIPIASIDNFLEHFRSIQRDIKEKLGIDIDKSCSNISRLRCYSYDEDAYFNLQADVYTGRYTEPAIERKCNFGTDTDSRRLMALIDLISNTGMDITCDRADWVKIGMALAGSYGENGLDMFHKISEHNAGYSQSECDKQYKSFMKSSKKCSISSIFYIADSYGVRLNNK